MQASSLVDAARRVMRTHLAGAEEILDPAAEMITYGFGPEVTDLACAIVPHGDAIALGFFRGSRLHDRDGLLQRWTTNHRLLVLRSQNDLHSPRVLDLLGQVRAMHAPRRTRTSVVAG